MKEGPRLHFLSELVIASQKRKQTLAGLVAWSTKEQVRSCRCEAGTDKEAAPEMSAGPLTPSVLVRLVTLVFMAVGDMA